MNQFKTAFIIILTILSNITIAQPENLVPNPSFEEYSVCPHTDNKTHYAIGWRAVNYSPNYFNECATVYVCDVPKNAAGFQYPRTGKAYASFSYGWYKNLYPGYIPQNACDSAILTGKAEVLRAKLKEKLVVNKKYYVTFFVSKADRLLPPNNIQRFNGCINKIGALFSTIDYAKDTTVGELLKCKIVPLPNFSHVYTNSIICDTANWIEVSGSFIADSAYEYINIGVFFRY